MGVQNETGCEFTVGHIYTFPVTAAPLVKVTHHAGPCFKQDALLGKKRTAQKVFEEPSLGASHKGAMLTLG